MHELTQKFVEALNELHQDKNVHPMIALFSEDATLSRVGVPNDQRGKDGARTFWTQYRDVFEDIDASFRTTVTDEGIACLEWSSHGTLRGGEEFSYDGVSVLEAAGDTVDAFRTYYDTAAFLSERKGVTA